MKNTNTKLLIASCIVLFISGIFVGRLLFREKNQTVPTHSHHNETDTWTCSMHPQIRSKEPSNCPLCGMALTPLVEATTTDLSSIKMSETAMQLAAIRTQEVGYGLSKKPIRLQGTVAFDDRLRFTQTAHVTGRIEQLHVDFEGAYVRKGQVIASLYAPDLIVAQQELLEAKKTQNQQPEWFAAVMQKLRNLKITDAQMERILSSGTPIHTFPMVAQHTGYVSQIHARTGDYIQAGTALYDVNGLATVWGWLDVYRSDIPWVQEGIPLTLHIPALPGTNFKTTLDYVDPFLEATTETAKARVVLNNSEGKIKPGMLLEAVLQVNTNADSLLQVPKTAVLWTGKTSLVYVKNASSRETSFQMRIVELGADLGDAYALISGLEAGEEIAVEGAFSIDAAAQLAGKYSMMQPPPKRITLSTKAQEDVEAIFHHYAQIQTALSQDQFSEALKKSQALDTVIKAIDLKELGQEATTVWLESLLEIRNVEMPLEQVDDVKSLRIYFKGLSNFLLSVADAFSPFSEALYVQYCPMAFDNQGARWLSFNEEILNPYFGNSMLRCGETERVLVP